MAASKLFTPVLRAKQPTAIQGQETAPIFMNPPTHPEIPVFSGDTGNGNATYPLRLGGDGASSTKPNTTRQVMVRDDFDPE